MFEKSLYDLIRGLRNHKGAEKEYIQNSLKECRAEVKGSDMDLKATALLKLVYLEMFGHDMSWASFHVLEVMSSQKYLQKRVGYLGAVQSFRPDTEVLMLATNLLKKDLTSTAINNMTLPIMALPHIITSSLAMATVSDLLPRLTHSSPSIRKKTIVTLYRLALVYPETLRPAWPKIKERLMDEGENPSVTAAIVNVICELGWRRPQDFLPLAPRLFELLVDSGNNWMAIKLIKLFATLTPLEPRLVKKLLPPLTSIIQTTPAMSLLYECIHGIIQGGILGSTEDIAGGDKIATLCVSKLRSMIIVEGDPNLKFVALLAFNKIVATHPHLVAEQEDVILECIDSPDISIRLRALDLVVGMVSPDNLMSIVGRLMRQLRTSPSSAVNYHSNVAAPIEPQADSDDEAPEIAIKAAKDRAQEPVLPDDYRIDVINRILQMCSSNSYGNLTDFEWYIDILTQLVRNAPQPASNAKHGIGSSPSDPAELASLRIGQELRNVAVRVRAVRVQATRAAGTILQHVSDGQAPDLSASTQALIPLAWIAGEYATLLVSATDTMNNILSMSKPATSSACLIIYLQAIIKLYAHCTGAHTEAWTPARKSLTSLMTARVLHTFTPLAMHPDLEVQERAAGFLELLRLTSEAISGHEASPDSDSQDPPLLLTQAVPSLFIGMELNSVAAGAQRNVPLPQDIDVDEPINPNLSNILRIADATTFAQPEDDEFAAYYHARPSAGPAPAHSEPAINRLGGANEEPAESYQNAEDDYLDADILARRRAERLERNKDDPFYIAPDDVSAPIHSILKNNIGSELDLDEIPIMPLNLGTGHLVSTPSSPYRGTPHQRAVRQQIQVAADETLDSGTSTPRDDESDSNLEARQRKSNRAKSLLQVDSSHIEAFSLEGDTDARAKTPADHEHKRREDEEMARAMKEIERLRLGMQRAKERVELAGGDGESVVVVKKKTKTKKTKKAEDAAGAGPVEESGVKTKTKTKTKKRPAPEATVPSTSTSTENGATKPPNENVAEAPIPSILVGQTVLEHEVVGATPPSPQTTNTKTKTSSSSGKKKKHRVIEFAEDEPSTPVDGAS